MSQEKAKFVYVLYIVSNLEETFNALIDKEITKDYWSRRVNDSDWKVGSRWAHRDYDNPKLVDIVGKVLEFRPPHRLAVTWALPGDEGNPDKTSQVTYELHEMADLLRLKVSHENLDPDSEMWRGITQGWPIVLSSLKTLLETGRPMEMMTKRWEGPLPD